MSLTVTLTLDDETGAYLKRIAADQGRTPAEVATWIVTEDLRRERTIDAELLAHVGDAATAARQQPPEPRYPPRQDATSRERAGA
jgi:predicted transcriptional regulator